MIFVKVVLEMTEPGLNDIVTLFAKTGTSLCIFLFVACVKLDFMAFYDLFSYKCT